MGLLITFAGAVLTVGICIALVVFLDKDPTDPVKHPLPYGRGFLVHRQDTF